MGVRIRNQHRFGRDLKRFAKEVNLDLRTVLRSEALQIFTGITKRTPVDKGFARAGWLVGIDKPRGNPQTDTSGDGPGEQGAVQINREESANIDKVTDPFSTIIINNHLPYIKALEKGSSHKAPDGMVKVTLNERTSFFKKFFSS